MIVKQKDAANKQCRLIPPLGAQQAVVGGRANIVYNGCGASGCMLWRWYDETPQNPDDKTGFCGAGGRASL